MQASSIVPMNMQMVNEIKHCYIFNTTSSIVVAIESSFNQLQFQHLIV